MLIGKFAKFYIRGCFFFFFTFLLKESWQLFTFSNKFTLVLMRLNVEVSYGSSCNPIKMSEFVSLGH